MATEIVSATEVRAFFKHASLDVAELVIELAKDEIGKRKEASAAVSRRMAKARAGRGKKAAAATVPATQSATAAELPANQPASRPVGRPRQHQSQPANEQVVEAIG